MAITLHPSIDLRLCREDTRTHKWTHSLPESLDAICPRIVLRPVKFETLLQQLESEADAFHLPGRTPLCKIKAWRPLNSHWIWNTEIELTVLFAREKGVGWNVWIFSLSIEGWALIRIFVLGIIWVSFLRPWILHID